MTQRTEKTCGNFYFFTVATGKGSKTYWDV
jgi:hypothetical protein